MLYCTFGTDISDLRKEACGQRIRATVPCSGYRAAQVLRIEDETQAVIGKAVG